jgi:hypothetical protein
MLEAILAELKQRRIFAVEAFGRISASTPGSIINSHLPEHKPAGFSPLPMVCAFANRQRICDRHPMIESIHIHDHTEVPQYGHFKDFQHHRKRSPPP